jgi:hypothetical protein
MYGFMTNIVVEFTILPQRQVLQANSFGFFALLSTCWQAIVRQELVCEEKGALARGLVFCPDVFARTVHAKIQWRESWSRLLFYN